MKSIKVRVETLEKRSKQTSAAWQLQLLYQGVGGDQQALDEFGRISASGKAIPLLNEMFEQIRGGLPDPQGERAKETG